MLTIIGKVKDIGVISDDDKRTQKIELEEVGLSGEYFSEGQNVVVFIFNADKLKEKTTIYNTLKELFKNL